MKTVRFAQLVEAAGKPEHKLLWGPAEKDKELQSAIKANRVLTLHQSNVGQKKDFGTVGFVAEALAQYLIFPKSLKRFDGARVVGINYDLLESPKLVKPKGPSRGDPHKAKARPEKKRVFPVFQKKADPDDEETEEPAEPAKPAAPETKGESEKSAPPEEPAGSDEPAQSKRSGASDKPMGRAARAESDDVVSVKEIVKTVRAALKDLEAGKSVPALRRLEKLERELSS